MKVTLRWRSFREGRKNSHVHKELFLCRTVRRALARRAYVCLDGGRMLNLAKCRLVAWFAPLMLVAGIAPVHAQAFKVQCPETTITHSTVATSANPVGGSIKCQQISGGDGYATMADGTQTYLFAFGPLSGLNDLASGLPGTQQRSIFMTPFDPAAAPGTAASNGAVGVVLDADGQVDPGTGFSLCAGANPPASCFTGHVDPRQIMDVRVM